MTIDGRPAEFSCIRLARGCLLASFHVADDSWNCLMEGSMELSGAGVGVGMLRGVGVPYWKIKNKNVCLSFRFFIVYLYFVICYVCFPFYAYVLSFIFP